MTFHIELEIGVFGVLLLFTKTWRLGRFRWCAKSTPYRHYEEMALLDYEMAL